jgi:peptide/nickel transport system substrate-binding protein
MDPSKGALLERFDGFKGDPAYHRAPIKTVQLIPIPDKETQVAQLLTGGVDVLRNPDIDTVASLKTHPDIGVTDVMGGEFVYLLLDAAGRSGIAPLTDVRVRRAIAMAIDRDAIRRTLIAGGGDQQRLDAICYKTMIACRYSGAPPSYDPAAAKRLLAEAGYPDGFSTPLQIHVPVRQVGEAIALQLRRIGIQAAIEMMPISVYTKKRADGQLSMFVGTRPTAYPEATAVLTSLFGGQRDYAHDAVITDAMEQAGHIFDIAKRAEILEPAFDRNNAQVYVLPIATLPTVFVHGKNVTIQPNLLSPQGIEISDFVWK